MFLYANINMGLLLLPNLSVYFIVIWEKKIHFYLGRLIQNSKHADFYTLIIDIATFLPRKFRANILIWISR